MRAVYTCTRCQYTWIQRKEGHTPKECPGCRSPYWHTPKGVLPRGRRPKS